MIAGYLYTASFQSKTKIILLHIPVKYNTPKICQQKWKSRLLHRNTKEQSKMVQDTFSEIWKTVKCSHQPSKPRIEKKAT